MVTGERNSDIKMDLPRVIPSRKNRLALSAAVSAWRIELALLPRAAFQLELESPQPGRDSRPARLPPDRGPVHAASRSELAYLPADRPTPIEFLPRTLRYSLRRLRRPVSVPRATIFRTTRNRPVRPPDAAPENCRAGIRCSIPSPRLRALSSMRLCSYPSMFLALYCFGRTG